MSPNECERRFGHNWYTRKFGGVYCTRCSVKAERSCVVNGKRIGYHCDPPLPVEGEGNAI